VSHFSELAGEPLAAALATGKSHRGGSSRAAWLSQERRASRVRRRGGGQLVLPGGMSGCERLERTLPQVLDRHLLTMS
jgi:hypothetical protein